MQSKINLAIGALAFSTLGVSGCGVSANNGGSSYDTTTAEVVGESIAGQVNSSDSGGGVVSMNLPNQKLPLSSKIKQLAQEAFESKAYGSSCSSQALTSGSACSSGVTNITLNCNGLLGTWSGVLTATFNPTSACGDTIASIPNGDSFTFTSSGITLTGALGAAIESDSNSSGYASPVSGGTQVTCGSSGGCLSSRSINILGVHRKLTSASGITLFDHSLSTTVPLSVTGTGSSKQITSGTLQLQHNLARYTASAQITQALTFSSGCCLPVGGQITTTFTAGNKSGSEVTTFGPSCGKATVNGNAVTLYYCQ